MKISAYFHDFEFWCRCGRPECDAQAPRLPSEKLLSSLDSIRADFGSAVRVSSGMRCDFWNRKQGGVANSGHLDGTEVDVICSGGSSRHRLLVSAYHRGVPRIGIGSTFVHIGTSARLTQGVTWLYGQGLGAWGALGC